MTTITTITTIRTITITTTTTMPIITTINHDNDSSNNDSYDDKNNNDNSNNSNSHHLEDAAAHGPHESCCWAQPALKFLRSACRRYSCVLDLSFLVSLFLFLSFFVLVLVLLSLLANCALAPCVILQHLEFVSFRKRKTAT